MLTIQGQFGEFATVGSIIAVVIGAVTYCMSRIVDRRSASANLGNNNQDSARLLAYERAIMELLCESREREIKMATSLETLGAAVTRLEAASAQIILDVNKPHPDDAGILAAASRIDAVATAQEAAHTAQGGDVTPPPATP